MTKKQDAVINQAIADRVGKFRKEHKLTLDGLAKRAEISKGMLVQIEKGNANPSIGILCKLANALGVAVADIVAMSDGPNIGIKHRNDMPVLWKGEHGGTARLLASTKGSVMVELWRWVMFPGEVFTSDAHAKGTIELIHVEEGTLSVTVVDETFVLGPESSLTATMDVPHSYENRSDAEVSFTMTVYERTEY
ncbi:XRE family transcriptional regulator [Idiomarina sp. HP20-50]|uniref:helix-turn-helix domain-containing protein n=1 Tax=Idiomarina sp. HP20-50 TaxID=3070813 RepID=UPI00294AACD7|nr:XRE family transcriptional regulator [Idiomarina sp. HP20-50]MDV6316455.1 XRE family transcriptional regulator [Idiomarina sp. HP20-50]